MAADFVYPESRRDDLVEDLHGHRIADPYRWLEDPDADDTQDWVKRQNAFTEDHFNRIGERAWFTELMNAVVRRPRAGVPVKRVGKYFVSRNDGSLDQDQIFVAESLAELRSGGKLLLDPNTLSDEGTTSIRGFSVSDDGSHLSFQVSEGGSDWVDFKLIDPDTGAAQDDAPIQTKFSAAWWLPDNASFLYAAVPHEGRADGAQAAAVQTGMLKLHRVGQPEDADELIMDVRADYRQGFAMPVVSADRTLVAVYLSEGTEHVNKLWFLRVTEGEQGSELSGPIKVLDAADAEYEFVRNVGSEIILYTDLDAPRGRVVKFDLDAFQRTGELELTELIAERDSALQFVEAAGEELITVRLADAQPQIQRHGLDGRLLGEVDVPGGAVTGIWADPDSREWFIGMSSVTSPTRAHRIEVGGGEPEPLDDLVPPGADFTAPEVTIERRRATSADGIEVPYFLITTTSEPINIRPEPTSTRPEPVEGPGSATSPEPVEGPRPTLLYGYGGFNIPVEADYRPLWPGWLAAGGTLAIANLRGGGEFGRDWYDGGRLGNKQNVFNDFIAIGDHLVSTGITTHDQLAIHGRSNGGLLVGAVMTQRPDLAAAALPGVGVLDILRFHKFTAGAAWTSDFGDPGDPDDFELALAYSPLHNVKPTAYPATLVTTGDHDDRVVPLHSHKFTATLQAAQQGDAPILTRIETQTGHGMGKPAAMVAAEFADMLAFAAHYTGLKLPELS